MKNTPPPRRRGVGYSNVEGTLPDAALVLGRQLLLFDMLERVVRQQQWSDTFLIDSRILCLCVVLVDMLEAQGAIFSLVQGVLTCAPAGDTAEHHDV